MSGWILIDDIPTELFWNTDVDPEGAMKERHLRVDLSDDDKQRAEEYAEKHGLRMRRAYGDLIRAGLDSEG